MHRFNIDMRHRKSNRIVNPLTLAGLLACSFLISALPAQTTDPPAPPAAKDDSIAPLNVAQKFNYRVTQAFGIRGFFQAAVGAGLNQVRDVPHEWGEGSVGFGERFGSSFGQHLVDQTMEFTLESALHEDPRYFPSHEKGAGARIRHALLATVITRTDSGGQTLAIARITSAFATGQLVNAWQPPSTNSVSEGLTRTGLIFAEHAAWNVAQEFVPRLRPKSMRQ